MSGLVGESLGRYQITAQLGTGGMATVYKAYDTRLERYVAIKVIRSEHKQDEGFLKRFEREAKTLAQLSHPNIVKVLDYGEYEGAPYLVMEYVGGGTFKKKGIRHHWVEAARLLAPMARALEYAHQHNIIHRDVKPANFLLTETGVPMLSDFGIAKILESEETSQLTGTGVGIGTPAYMAPEQGSGKGVDERADIYSLGVVFYEMVTGQTPYQADTPLAVLLMAMNDPLPPPKTYVSDLPDAVEQVLLKALAKNPVHRFQNMGAFAQALEKLAAGSQSLPDIQVGIQDMETAALEAGVVEVGKPVREREVVGNPAVPVAKKPARKLVVTVVVAVLAVIIVGCLVVWAAYILNICMPPGPWPSLPWCNVQIPSDHNRLVCPPPGPWGMPPWCP
jgi:serine/threonine protein kinase